MENINNLEQASRILNGQGDMMNGVGYNQHLAPTLLLIISIVIVLMVWSLVWKGFALWKAAKKGDKVWFVVFLIINTLGILDILYIYVFSKDKKSTIANNSNQSHTHNSVENESKN